MGIKMHIKILTFLVLVISSALAEALFESNLKDIKAHNENRGVNTYTKGVNQFTDMTQQEFQAFTKGFPSVPKNTKMTTVSEESLKALRAKYANYEFEDS